jgi:hypothetical protein
MHFHLMSSLFSSTVGHRERAASIVWVVGACLGAVPIATSAVVPPPEGVQFDTATVAVNATYLERAGRARTPSEFAALARDMFANRKETGNSEELYALDIAPINLAAKDDDPLLLMTICDVTAKGLEFDRIGLFFSRVAETSAPLNPPQWPTLFDGINGMVSSCPDGNRFDEAGQLAAAIAHLGEHARDPKATTTMAGVRKLIADRKKAREYPEEMAVAANASNASP